MKKNEDKLRFEISAKGSLGLLAYGDIGLREWRKVKNNSLKENDEEKKED